MKNIRQSKRKSPRSILRRLPFASLILALALAALPAGILAAPAQEKAMTDQEITQAVDVELLIHTGVAANDIRVATQDGIVTLTGTANTLLEKNLAAELAGTVRGVRSVINQLAVEPAEKSDMEIRSAVVNRLAADPATESYEIQTAVTGGTATLSGQVQSYQERALAAKVVSDVRGVREVKNLLTVNYQHDRLDSEIQGEVERRMELDVWVDSPVLVNVENGVVTLRGRVGSVHEKTRATLNGWVAGTKQVKNDDLVVDPLLKDRTKRTQESTRKTDFEIRKAVEDALLYDARLEFVQPEVSVHNGMVTLQGVVDNLRAKHAAAQTASNTIGVVRVRNLIKVLPDGAVKDEKIAGKVRYALKDSAVVDSYEIAVSVTKGKVYLNGQVDSPMEKQVAGEIAAQVNGVVDVQNRLFVEAPYSTVLPAPSSYPLWPQIYWPLNTDAQIREDIRDQLFWSPFVDSDEVSVFVENGIATLTGTVDSWAEYGAAQDNAMEGGAFRVENKLEVREEDR